MPRTASTAFIAVARAANSALRLLLPLTLPLLAACAGTYGEAPPAAKPAAVRSANDAIVATYVIIGDGGQAIARAITRDVNCPLIDIDNEPRSMSVRATGAIVPARAGAQADSKVAAFPLLTCETVLPANAGRASIAGHDLPAVHSNPTRIVVIGDSGCRMKGSENYYQACNDPQQWPLQDVAETAASLAPELVVHVGDYHYRESPCPKDNVGCAHSPWGYGADTWQADVFTPARSLFAAAPWVAARGNHESCNRAGQGWFRFLDPRPWSAARSCDDPANDANADYSEPYAVPLGSDSQLIVFDSARAGGKPLSEKDAAYGIYRRQLESAGQLAKNKPHSFFLSHHPLLGLDYYNGAHQGGNAALRSVLTPLYGQRLLPAGIDLALHGHVHLFQSVSFKSDHPVTVLSGNGGSDLNPAIPTPLPAGFQPAPGAEIEDFHTNHDFGFLLLEQDENGWKYTEYDRHGKASLSCRLRGGKSVCAAALAK